MPLIVSVLAFCIVAALVPVKTELPLMLTTVPVPAVVPPMVIPVPLVVIVPPFMVSEPPDWLKELVDVNWPPLSRDSVVPVKLRAPPMLALLLLLEVSEPPVIVNEAAVKLPLVPDSVILLEVTVPRFLAAKTLLVPYKTTLLPVCIVVLLLEVTVEVPPR